MSHRQLTQEQRYHISAFLRAGYTQTQIAFEIGVHKSTICRELKRNIFWWNSRIAQYKPDYAQSHCRDRHRYKKKHVKFTPDVQNYVREKILEDWSPE